MAVDPVSLAITAALAAAQMAMTASQHIEGPRLDDLSATVADYGTPLNYVYGLRKVGTQSIFCEPIKEVPHRRKSKGGKLRDYTYFGTWAVAVADHEISAFKRIWFDGHLVYDVDAEDATSILTAEDYELESSVRFYLGTETQDPDPRILATIEANEGAGTCPAYRGVAYIMFEDLPLEKLGNRFPQIQVEIVGLTKTMITALVA